MTKGRHRLVRWTRWAIAASIVAAWFVFLRPMSLGGSVSYVTVSGTSMEPGMHTGDFVLARKQASYRAEDIVAYRIPRGEAGAGMLVIHRIVGGSARDGYVTKGDNREKPDLWRPRPADVVGKRWLFIPGIGRWLGRLRNPAPLAALAGALTTMLLLPGRLRRRETPGRAAARAEPGR